MSKTKHLTPGFFWRLLGYKGGSLNISEKGITLNKDNKSYFIDNHSLLKRGEIREAWFAFDVAGPLAFGVLIVVEQFVKNSKHVNTIIMDLICIFSIFFD